MAEAVMVTLNTILFLEDIYPRIKVDDDRIKYFVELMKNGKEPPPLFLTKYDQPDDGRQYVLLDGKHRSEAYRLLGVRDVPACIFDIPRKHWRLKSAGFNAVASKPLSSDDMKRAIIDAWVKDGVRDVNKIADLIENAWTPQYINKVLKPLRDQERKELEAKAWELREQGLTQAEIAKEVGMSRGWVFNTLQWISICQKRDERLEHLDQGRTQPAMNAEIFHMPVEIGSDNEGCVADMTALPTNTAEQTESPLGDIQQGGDSKTRAVIPTVMIDKIRVKSHNDSVQKKWRRHLKESPVKEMQMVYRDTHIIRQWIADVKRGSYDKVTLELLHECARKMIMASNELLLAIRDFLDQLAELEQKPGLLPPGMAEEYSAEEKAEACATVKAYMIRNWSRIQGMPEEDRKDLEMDCLLDALEAQRTWDDTKSSLRTWINNNLDWHFKDLAKKEYKRIQTMAEYRKHVQSLTNY